MERKLTPAVHASIAALDLDDKHLAIARLAMSYAQSIDDWDENPAQYFHALEKLGPKLQAALAAMGATLDVRAAAAPRESTGPLSTFRAGSA